MVKVKKINENRLDSLLKEVTVLGEQIRSMQDEKQSVMDQFRKEQQRFRDGQISKQAFGVSAKKVTRELAVLDSKIRNNIRSARQSAGKAQAFVEAQLPERVMASTGGLRRPAKRKAKAKAKAKKRKAPRRAKKAARKPARKAKKKAAKKRPARRKAAKKARPKRKAARKPARKAKKRPARKAAKRKRPKAKKKSSRKRKR